MTWRSGDAVYGTIFVILKIDPTDTWLMDELRDNNQAFNRLMHDQQERLKELACINGTTAILKEGKPIEESLQQIVLLLPAAWQYPEYTVARISFAGKEFESVRFFEDKLENDHRNLSQLMRKRDQLRFFIPLNSMLNTKVRF